MFEKNCDFGDYFLCLLVKLIHCVIFEEIECVPFCVCFLLVGKILLEILSCPFHLSFVTGHDKPHHNTSDEASNHSYTQYPQCLLILISFNYQKRWQIHIPKRQFPFEQSEKQAITSFIYHHSELVIVIDLAFNPETMVYSLPNTQWHRIVFLNIV